MDIKGMLLLEDHEVFELFKLEARALGRTLFTDNKNYMHIKGTSEDECGIGLVAHVDTVSPFSGRVGKVIKERYGVLSAWRTQHKGQKHKERTILGADDRAGCYGLLQIMREDARPSIILTNYEERGGIGVGVYTNETELWRNMKFLVELDRAGVNEYVQYVENTHEVHTFMAQFAIANGGYGTYSDIATISRATGIPSVNIAIGYRAQHSDREFLDLAGMELGIQKTRLIVNRFCKDKPVFGKCKERSAERPPQIKTTYSYQHGKPPIINTRKEINEADVKCAECGLFNGSHYRSCSEWTPETIDEKQQHFPFSP